MPNDIEREKKVVNDLYQQHDNNQRPNTELLKEAGILSAHILYAERTVNNRLRNLNPALTQEDLAYLNNKTANFFGKIPHNNYNYLAIPPPYQQSEQYKVINDLITQNTPPQNVAAVEVNRSPTAWSGSTPNPDIIANAVRINLPVDLKDSIIFTKTQGSLKASTPDKKIDFEMKTTRDSDNISGNTNPENLKAMSTALVANLKHKLSSNPPPTLSINLNDCSPPEVAREFKKCIDAEIDRITNVLCQSPQTEQLANRLNSLKAQIEMPSNMPTETASANIGSPGPTPRSPGPVSNNAGTPPTPGAPPPPPPRKEVAGAPESPPRANDSSHRLA